MDRPTYQPEDSEQRKAQTAKEAEQADGRIPPRSRPEVADAAGQDQIGKADERRDEASHHHEKVEND